MKKTFITLALLGSVLTLVGCENQAEDPVPSQEDPAAVQENENTEQDAEADQDVEAEQEADTELDTEADLDVEGGL